MHITKRKEQIFLRIVVLAVIAIAIFGAIYYFNSWYMDVIEFIFRSDGIGLALTFCIFLFIIVGIIKEIDN